MSGSRDEATGHRPVSAGEETPWRPPTIDVAATRTGDMPGDKVQIEQAHIDKATTAFPHLLRRLAGLDGGRLVVSVFGGSGVGKSEIASVLAHYCTIEGFGSYIMSGDNYPHRIPEQNDLERLSVFRNAALSRLARSEDFSNRWMDALLDKRPEMTDLSLDGFGPDELSWATTYVDAGRRGLASYLGTENEIDFSMVNTILDSFRSGRNGLVLKRMGRAAEATRYEAVDFEGIQVLFLEWTHGGNPLVSGVDYSIFLFSTPEETLAHRLSRARDKNTDSPLIRLVLEVEHEKLVSWAGEADLIISKAGEVLSQDDFQRRLD